MLDAISSALSGLNVATRKIENSANNIANLQTPGFKAGTVDTAAGANGGATVSSISKVNTGGGIMTTSNPIDIAINGSGFLQVALPNGGTGYTRAGNLQLDGGGRLVTTDGNPISPGITVPGGSTALTIDGGGNVSAQVGGNTVSLGQIQLANFANPSGLQAAGGNLFLQTAASGSPVVGNPGTGGLGGLFPGGVESSNVDIATEMVDQVLAKTAFTANISVIKTANEMTGALLNIKA
jgi:flagellar basal-body rod protein FlgG